MVDSWKVLDNAKIDKILRTDIKQIESLSIYIEKVTKFGKDIVSESLSSIISKQSNPKLYIESLSLNKYYGGISVNNNLLEDALIVNIKRKDPQFTGIDRFQSFDVQNINNKIVRFEGFNERGKQVWKQLSSKRDDQFSFVITKDKKLRLGYGHYNLSSMADEVISAGSVQMRNGKFSFISNGSGHYASSLENLERVIHIFKKMGLMTDDFKITKFKPKKN
ncbi:hypothetical protein UCDSB2_390003 [Tenacibaculum maritimum]|nr:hypothetical protein UCDSB2_390003 [Tenacibaculum maritimum]